MFNKIDFLDDSLTGGEIRGKCEDVVAFKGAYPCAFVAIADNEVRIRYSRIITENHFFVPTIVAPGGVVSTNAKLGIGTMIFATGRVSAEAEVGNFCLVQAGGVVESRAVICDYVLMDSGAIVEEGAVVPEGEWIERRSTFGKKSQ